MQKSELPVIHLGNFWRKFFRKIWKLDLKAEKSEINELALAEYQPQAMPIDGYELDDVIADLKEPPMKYTDEEFESVLSTAKGACPPMEDKHGRVIRHTRRTVS